MVNGCAVHSSHRLFTLHLKICQLVALTTIKVELRQAEVVVNVVETTYFGIVFITSPKGSPAGIGSNAAPWICHVLRPRSSASLRLIS